MLFQTSVLRTAMAGQLLRLVNSFRLSTSQDVGIAFVVVFICAVSAVKGNIK